MGTVRDLEAVLFGECGVGLVAVGLLERCGVLLVEDVAEPLEEQQREDERLVLAGVDGASQQRGGAPEVGLELALGDAGAHAIPRSASSWFSRSSAAHASSSAAFSASVASATVGMSTSSGWAM